MFEMYVPNADASTDRVQARVTVGGRDGGRVRAIDWNRDWANGHSVGSAPSSLSSPALFNQLVPPPLGCAN